ncbi:hypothetical protein [Enterococcus mundtii]|uniref:hypothetical protein n=1 Tax=Enterococcus mundtii TaxID=53346 RepID=UPI001A967A80|nr:hypothetical protein [Enterococcus mundtii]MBO1087255.1 hypothetical protein [Enterococcus mundtii]
MTETPNKEYDESSQLRYAETLTDPKGNMRPTTVSLGSTDSSRIERMLEAPESNYVQIAGLMNALRRKNGTVGSTLRYLMSHLTYNYSMYSAPTQKGEFSMENGTLEDYLGAASYLNMYGIKRMASYFTLQVLTNGMAFFYEMKDSKDVSYMEFPIGWGRISSMKNGVYRWEIDMSQMKDELIPYMPNEIQKAYEEYNNKANMDEKRWRDGKYYRLSDKAVAFCIDNGVMTNGGIAISEFASLLVDSLSLEKAKNNIEIKDDIDTVRIIHAKIPLDKDNKPSMSAKAAREYDNALKRSLPKGVVGVTNPMGLSNVPLSGAGSTKSYEIADKAQKQLFLSTGTPSSLFGSETTSSNIVKLTVKKDAAWLYTTIIPMLEDYYNTILSSFKTKSGLIYRISFLRQSNFTIDEDIKNIKDAVTMGGSRLDYLAALGNEPLEAYSKLVMEQQVLNIDSIMLPKQTSFTMSSKDSDGAGRPTTNEPTDDTDRINDSQ